MLKRTKSANQSVIQDAVDADNTSVTLAGPIQPDEDDYGYVSQEASAFYNKMMEKYSKMSEEPKFNLSKKKIVSTDLNSTKERVRAALEREKEEALLPHKRKRKHREDNSDSKQQEDYTGKYQPEAEPNIPKKKPKIPAPPPINFNDLLKLAEKKQFEPIVIEAKPKEEEKLYTKKQKKELEREREWRERKEGKLPPLESSKISTNNKNSKQSVEKQTKINTDFKIQRINAPNVELVRKTDRVDSPVRAQNLPMKKGTELLKKIPPNKERDLTRENVLAPNNKSNFTSKNPPQKLKPTGDSRQKEFAKSNNREIMKSTSKELGKPLNNREPINSIPSKHFASQKPKQFPPKDLKPKQFPPSDRSREFPPRDIKRKPLVNKRRILDDDEEYDSEMDDFIDDGPEESEDYSKLISEIFKYDKSKYRNMDDDDDNMESTFAQQMREEVISTKIGKIQAFGCDIIFNSLICRYYGGSRRYEKRRRRETSKSYDETEI